MVANESASPASVIGSKNRVRSAEFLSACLLLFIRVVIVVSLSFDFNVLALTNHSSLLGDWGSDSSWLLRLGICLGTGTKTALACFSPLCQELDRFDQQSLLDRRSPASLAMLYLPNVMLFCSTARRISSMFGSSDQSLAGYLSSGRGVAASATGVLATRTWSYSNSFTSESP